MGCHIGKLLVLKNRSSPTIALELFRHAILVDGQFAIWLTDNLLIVRQYDYNPKLNQQTDTSLLLLRVNSADYAIIPNSSSIESTAHLDESGMSLELSPSTKHGSTRVALEVLDWQEISEA